MFFNIDTKSIIIFTILLILLIFISQIIRLLKKKIKEIKKHNKFVKLEIKYNNEANDLKKKPILVLLFEKFFIEILSWGVCFMTSLYIVKFFFMIIPNFL